MVFSRASANKPRVKGCLLETISSSPLGVACVAGGFKRSGVYGEGNYGERNEKDVYGGFIFF